MNPGLFARGGWIVIYHEGKSPAAHAACARKCPPLFQKEARGDFNVSRVKGRINQ